MYRNAYQPVVQPADGSLRLDGTPSAAATFARGSLTSGAVWLLLSNVSYAACQWAALVALAKLVSATSLGHFGLALAVATPVVMVTGLALRAVQATDVHRRYAFADYLSVRLLANVVAAAVIGAVTIGGFEAAAAAILVPIGTAKLAESTSETCYGLAQRHDRMRLVALSKVARGALGLAAMVAVVATGGTLAHGAWALAATWTVFLVVVDLPAAGQLEPIFTRPKAATLWRLTRESAPLGVVNGVFAVTQSLPRYLLALSHGAAAVGYFTAVAALGPALDQLAGSVGHAAAPRLGWAVSTDGRRFRLLLARLLGFAAATGALLVAAAMLGGHQFLRVAYSEEYAPYRTALVLVTLAGGFTMMNSIAYFALIAARKSGVQLAIHCLGLVVTAAGGAWLIPRFGVSGAAAVLSLGSATMTVASARVLIRATRSR